MLPKITYSMNASGNDFSKDAKITRNVLPGPKTEGKQRVERLGPVCRPVPDDETETRKRPSYAAG